MTKSYFNGVQNFKTKSGVPITIGTGTGTKWQWLKKNRPEKQKNDLTPELVDQLSLALKTGYNHLDTAEIYTTHPEVAEAIRLSGKSREDLWLTTKYCPGFLTLKAPSKSAAEFIDTALTELKTDYIDLLLIHSPFFGDDISHGETIESAWKDLINAKKTGKVRYIGVSNFAIPHLKQTFAVSESPELHPVVNQIEFHPFLQNQSKDIIEFSKKNNILIEAYGPLTPLFRVNDAEVQASSLYPLITRLSEKYNKTDAQILLRYTYQKGILPITTSSKEDRIRQSLQIVEFELEDDEIKAIDEEGSKHHVRGFFGDQFENSDLI